MERIRGTERNGCLSVESRKNVGTRMVLGMDEEKAENRVTVGLVGIRKVSAPCTLGCSDYAKALVRLQGH